MHRLRMDLLGSDRRIRASSGEKRMNRREAIGAAIGAVAGACVPWKAPVREAYIESVNVIADSRDPRLWHVSFEFAESPEIKGGTLTISTKRKPIAMKAMQLVGGPASRWMELWT